MAYQRFIYHGNIAGLLSALCHLTVSGLSDAAHGAATASNTVGKSNLSTCIAIVAELVLATLLSKHNVVYTTPEKLSKAKRQLLATSKGGNNQQRHSHRMLAASPLITSQRPTNFSTITEEEEQQCAKPATGNYKRDVGGTGTCTYYSHSIPRCAPFQASTIVATSRSSRQAMAAMRKPPWPMSIYRL